MLLTDFDGIFWRGGGSPRTSRLDFGDPERDPDPEFF